jgi:hypothetical protein
MHKNYEANSHKEMDFDKNKALGTVSFSQKGDGIVNPTVILDPQALVKNPEIGSRIGHSQPIYNDPVLIQKSVFSQESILEAILKQPPKPSNIIITVSKN